MPKYSELFTLHPIETVIEINKADIRTEAKRLVSTFVITESLGQQITDVALPQLDFARAVEGKGIFVVGNFGTGKSHVMSFLSILAEHEDYVQYVRDSAWQQKLQPFAGKYKVRRLQIAASLMSLYDMVTEQLAKVAQDSGFSFTFKDQRQVANIKDEFRRFMGEFDTKCPGMGVMLVVDELLWYLHSRNDQDLAVDLSVLQALGEFSNDSRFVFMAGLQQSLFNNPRFNHMASAINRIRQRYYDFVIDNKGVAQLIEQYLFEKTDTQRQQIRELLLPLCDLYEVVPEKLDQFVALFPAHPDFIDEFQRVFVVERREILTTLTKVARGWLDREAKSDTLDLITADDYYPYIEQDQGLRANQDIVKVTQNVFTITARIRSDFKDGEDKESAIRLVHALAVNRLTTPSITDPVGLTPRDLKNNLIWHTSIPMKDPEFLTAAAKRLLDRTRAAVNGQFLAVSETSGQWYIDPTRVVDYEQQVETYAEVSIPKDVVQRYLNELFTRVLELDNEDPIIPGRLWEYNTLTWTAKNVARPGWLFFGFPNQRSTAQPPKDFYLFIVPSRRITGLFEDWSDTPDESYWFIEDFDDSFLDLLGKYAAARELAAQSRGDDRKAFDQIAGKRYLEPVIRAFVDNAGDWISIRWNGQTKRFADWVHDLAPAKETGVFKSKLEAISEVMFASHFDAKFPNYPAFEVKTYENTRAQNAGFALEIICKHGLETDTGKKVLKALQLYDDGAATPDSCPWLDMIRTELRELGPGKVLNNPDLFETRENRVFMKGESIEAEWLHVVIAAGVESGDLVVFGPNNTKYGAADLGEFHRNIKSCENIIRVASPAEVPLKEWRKLFKLMGVNEGLLATPQTYQTGLQDFQTELSKWVIHLVETKQMLTGSLPFAPEDPANNKLSDTSAFDMAQASLEKLTPLNTKAKMSNLSITETDFGELRAGLKQCHVQERVVVLLENEQQKLAALQRYEYILFGQPTFVTALECFKQQIGAVYADPSGADLEMLKTKLDDTTRTAMKTYQDLKKLHTLDKDGDNRKKVILQGASLKSLNKLAGVKVLNRSSLEQIWTSLENLPVDQTCTDEELLKSPTSLCPYTKFDPRNVPPDMSPAMDVLTECESDITELLAAWTAQLLTELNDPAIKSTFSSALKPADKKVVDKLIQDKTLPDPVDDAFVRIINEALSGLKTREVKSGDVAKAILGDGVPLKESELRDRFEKWLKEVLASDAPEAVRFVLKD